MFTRIWRFLKRVVVKFLRWLGWLKDPQVRPNKCCRKAANCDHHQLMPDLAIDQCKVCGCRHYELVADPGKFRVTGV